MTLRQIGYWSGGVVELLSRCRPRIGWRANQRLRTWGINLRDVCVCVLGGVLWGLALWAASL